MDIPRALAAPLEATPIDGDDQLAIGARSTPAAFATLYERHVERVFRFLRARGAPEEVASDLTATTFERALANIDRYRPGPAGFAPWLLRIARNAYIDAGRRARPTIQLSDADLLAPRPDCRPQTGGGLFQVCYGVPLRAPVPQGVEQRI
jgi:RNA polymerase sigma-70 factor (ECF subfamily)